VTRLKSIQLRKLHCGSQLIGGRQREAATCSAIQRVVVWCPCQLNASATVTMHSTDRAPRDFLRRSGDV